MYAEFKKAKDLWELLDKKYTSEDIGAKKFIIYKFLEFFMRNEKSVVSKAEYL